MARFIVYLPCGREIVLDSPSAGWAVRLFGRFLYSPFGCSVVNSTIDCHRWPVVVGLFLVVLQTITAAALGQRMQFSSPLPNPPAGGPLNFVDPNTSPAGGGPSVSSGSAAGAGGYGAPPNARTWAPAPGTPAPNPLAPGTLGPTTSFQGTIEPPPSSWDAYASPGSTPPPSLLQQDPYLQFGEPGAVTGGGLVAAPGNAVVTMRKFLETVQIDYVWMPGRAEKEFGINDVDLSATFAVPFLKNIETPLLITPGFAVHYWAEPGAWRRTTGTNLPPRVYDAYIDAAWNPRASDNISGELSFRLGIYSDFNRVTTESLRYQGKGMAVVRLSPGMTVKGGIWYLDRNRIKVLPAGGIILTPNTDLRLEILFPDPRISRKLTTYSNTQWWVYLAGKYGGGAWSLEEPAGALRGLDYNDIRISVGIEFDTLNSLDGLFEVGVAFDRELFRHQNDVMALNSTVFLRGGLVY